MQHYVITDNFGINANEDIDNIVNSSALAVNKKSYRTY